MKIEYFIVASIILTLGVGGCNYQEEEESISHLKRIKITKETREEFELDALHLYQVEVGNSVNNTDKYETQLSTKPINDILKMIQAVRNVEAPEADTVLNILNIKSSRAYTIPEIILEVDPELDASKKLSNGNLKTGNKALDSVFKDFKCEYIGTDSDYPNNPLITIGYPQYTNILYLGYRLNKAGFSTLYKWKQRPDEDSNGSMRTARLHEPPILVFIKSMPTHDSSRIRTREWYFKIENGEAKFDGYTYRP
jgi:hypothetical protein